MVRMSILIKMDMPERCGACPFENFGECDVDDHDVEKACYNKERDRACPLSEVQAHGRLIDADKLREEMLLFIEKNMLARDDARELLATVDEAPTVIEAED